MADLDEAPVALVQGADRIEERLASTNGDHQEAHGSHPTWYPNLGENRFSEERTFEAFDPVGSLTALFLVAADFDGDGDVDVAITSSRATTVTVLENTERGTSFAVAHSLTAAGRIDALVSGDVNGDGLADLVVAANLGLQGATHLGRVGVWRSLEEGEEGGFEEASTLRLGRIDSMVLSDVDGDAFPDLLIGRREGDVNTVGLLRGGGDGMFRSPLTFSAVGTVSWAIGPWADDFDGEGDADVAVANTDRTTLLFQGER